MYLVGVIVHGDPAALAHGEVNVGHCSIWDVILFAFAAAQHA